MAISGLLSWLIRVYAELEGTLNAVERVAEYTELHKEAAANMPDDPEKGWLTHGRIEFKAVVMSYREGLPPVLNGVNFVIEGGKKIGVVGRTGAGKSSLIVALYRIAELTSGHITIDLRDIQLLGLNALRSALTIVPQEPVLFSGSVKVDHQVIFLKYSYIHTFFCSSIWTLSMSSRILICGLLWKLLSCRHLSSRPHDVH